MPYWVQECPHCGYCSADIAVLIKGAKDLVSGSEYQNQLTHAEFVDLANKFLCEAMIYSNAEQLQDTVWAYLHAAWACDDAGQQENAINCRKQALEILFIIENTGGKLFEEQGGLELLITDLARRCGQFDLALEYIQKALELNIGDVIKKCLIFEKQLVENQDLKVHTLQEVLE